MQHVRGLVPQVTHFHREDGLHAPVHVVAAHSVRLHPSEWVLHLPPQVLLVRRRLRVQNVVDAEVVRLHVPLRGQLRQAHRHRVAQLLAWRPRVVRVVLVLLREVSFVHWRE